MNTNITAEEAKKASENKVFSILKGMWDFPLDTQRRNRQGNFLIESFVNTNRYYFDSRLCPEGFEQFDTDQDAWYFGVWVSKENLCVVTYAEGDCYAVICENKEQYNKEIQSLIDCYEEGEICRTIGEDGMTIYKQDRSVFLIQ